MIESGAPQKLRTSSNRSEELQNNSLSCDFILICTSGYFYITCNELFGIKTTEI